MKHKRIQLARGLHCAARTRPNRSSQRTPLLVKRDYGFTGLIADINDCKSPLQPSRLCFQSARAYHNQTPRSSPPINRRSARSYSTTATTTTQTPRVLVNDLKSQEILIDFNNGVATRYPSFWLRDHCPCPICTHPQTKQRQLDTFTLIDPETTKAVEVEATPQGLQVTWSSEPSSSPNHHCHHQSLYRWTWLQDHTPFTTSPTLINPRGTWQSISPAGPHPTVNYDEAMTTDQGLASLLRQIRTYGISFVNSTPVSTEATEALANRIAFIRHTHYGGFWEVVSEAKPVDTAYTNLYLPNHTDTTYFNDPCGLQMFHCLSHTSTSSASSSSSSSSSSSETSQPGEIEAGLGGESTFVDGFAAAAKLYSLNKDYYKYLSNVSIVSHASGDDEAGSFFNNALHASGFPVLNHSSSKPASPKNLSMVRWNNSDRHSTTSFPSHQSMSSWYAAARMWNGLVQSPEFEMVVKLTPGNVVIFDNWRVLHGRKAFEGVRRLCGAYIGMDDFLAKGRAVEERLAKANKDTV